MREVVQKMIEAEGEARRIVDAAKAEADRLLAEARRAAHETAERSLRDARAEADRILEKARDEAECERLERLAEAIAAVEAQVRLDERAQRGAVEAVVRGVCGKA
jgi:vacuolar-type H+-ATPase subunit H